MTLGVADLGGVMGRRHHPAVRDGEVDVFGETKAVGHVVEAVRLRGGADEVIAPRLVGLIWIVHAELLRRIESGLERGRTGHHLEHRSRWVETLGHAIQERTAWVVI